MAIGMVDMVQFAQDKKFTAFLLLLFLDLFMDGAESATQAEIERHIEMGGQYLATGQLSDALTHFHAAVEGDPSNYLTLFKRGTVYFALGKARNSLSDFSRVLELKPDFTTARAQRGVVHLKLGDFDKAELDFHKSLMEDPYNDDVNYLYSKVDPAREQWNSIENLIARGDHRTAIAFLTQLLEISPWSAKFRETRADCYINENDVLSAVSDLRSVNRLSQDSTGGYFRLAELLYNLGHTADALKEIRECLKLDPEHKDCFPFYKKLKKVEKALSDAQSYLDERQYEGCVESAEKVLKLESDIPMVIFSAKQLLCSCHVKDEQFTQAVTRCRGSGHSEGSQCSL
uniref:Uncharacterized protein n=1 Tax=Phlebotomus papatasi TaxID=29031 RepID=A0A1B0EZF9_PHLPP